MGNEFDISIWVLASTNENGVLRFEDETILIKALGENYYMNLYPELFDLIKEIVSELEPKKELGHEIKLKHIIKNGSHDQPSEEYFEVIDVREIPYTCAVCNKEISENDFTQLGVCGDQCKSVLIGTPPYIIF